MSSSPLFDRAIHSLREAGYKITGARQAVLAVLIENVGHLTSAEIIQMVGERDPSIGRASVFRTLDLLSELAIIRPTYLDPQTPTYVLMSSGHHAHIICTRCHVVTELDECRICDLIGEIESEHEIRFTAHLLEFYGLCASCRQAAQPAESEH